ncbi:hypothetical protein D9M72_358350 [compost metagenome]
MGSDAQKPVALDDGLLDQPELTVFQVSDATVDHVRRCTAGPLAVVSAFDERNIDAL